MTFTDDNTHIFYFTGEAIAYIHEISVYNYEGKHLGFFKDGWIRDNNGKCVLFTKGAIGGPEKRMKDIAPVISQKGLRSSCFLVLNRPFLYRKCCFNNSEAEDVFSLLYLPFFYHTVPTLRYDNEIKPNNHKQFLGIFSSYKSESSLFLKSICSGVW